MHLVAEVMFGNGAYVSGTPLIMKRISTLVILLLTFSLVGCFNNSGETVSDNKNPTEDEMYVEKETEQASIDFKRSDIEELFENAKEYTLPEHVSFMPEILSDDLVLFGAIINNPENRKDGRANKAAYFDLKNNSFEIVYHSEEKEATQIMTIGANEEYWVFFESFTFKEGDTRTFLYDIENNLLTEINVEPNTTLLARPYCAFGENGLMISYYEEDSGAVYKTYYYDYETLRKNYVDEKVVVSGYEDGVFYGNTFYREDEKQVWTYKEDSQEINKQPILGVTGDIFRVSKSDEIIVESIDYDTYKYYVYFYRMETNQGELLFEANNAELFVKKNNWLNWMGGRVQDDLGENLYNLETNEYYITSDDLCLSHAGIVRVRHLNDNPFSIPNSENSLFQLIEFNE